MYYYIFRYDRNQRDNEPVFYKVCPERHHKVGHVAVVGVPVHRIHDLCLLLDGRVKLHVRVAEHVWQITAMCNA